MLPRLLEFISLLRQNGVRVSTAETLDAARAVELVGLADPEGLRGALAAPRCKRDGDAQVLDELFELHFLRAGDFARKAMAAGSPLVEDLRRRGFTDDEIEALLGLLADEKEDIQGRYLVYAIPTAVVIDREGVVRLVKVSDLAAAEHTVEELLAQPAK